MLGIQLYAVIADCRDLSFHSHLHPFIKTFVPTKLSFDLLQKTEKAGSCVNVPLFIFVVIRLDQKELKAYNQAVLSQ